MIRDLHCFVSVLVPQSVKSACAIGVAIAVATTSVAGAQVGPSDMAQTSASVSRESKPASTLDFQTDLFTGRFLYSIPIVIPEGRNRTQPEIAVTYDSSRGNGDVGWGWALQCGGSIRRDTSKGVPVKWLVPPTAQSSGIKTYDDSKGFVFELGTSASRLVPVSIPVPSQPFGEYRAEIDQEFYRFTYASTGWTAVGKNGVVHNFGQSNGMTVTASGFDGTNKRNVYQWMLELSTDPSGNQVEYDYWPPVFGRHHLQFVRYGANTNGAPHNYTVEFVYESAFALRTTSFEAGIRIVNDQRLNEVIVKTAASGSRIRRYAFEYEPLLGGRHHSELKKVRRLGTFDDEEFPPLVFQYNGPGAQFAPKQPWDTLEIQGDADVGWRSISAVDRATNQAGTQIALVDMNRDGRPDRVLRKHPNPPAGQAKYVVQYNTGAGFAEQITGDPLLVEYPFTSQDIDAEWRSVAYTDFSGGSVLSVLMDIDSDGFPDRVEVPRSTVDGQSDYKGYFYVNRFDGSAFSTAPVTSLPRAGHYDVDSTDHEAGHTSPIGSNGESQLGGSPQVHSTLIDMNGDGLLDRLRAPIEAPGSGDPAPPYAWGMFLVQFNTGTLSETGTFGPTFIWPNVKTEVLGDEEDEGWRDLIMSESRDTSSGLYDINGDQLPDRVMKPRFSTDSLKVQLNNGLSFENIEDWGPFYFEHADPDISERRPFSRTGDSNNTWTLAMLEDMDNDGLLDRVIKGDGGTYFLIQYNDGNGFVTDSQLQPVAVSMSIDSQGQTGDPWRTPGNTTSSADVSVDLVDMNGDGLVDRVMRTVENTPPVTQWRYYWVQLQEYVGANRLHLISNSMGGTLTVDYASSASYDNQQHEWTTDEERFVDNVGMLPFGVDTVAAVNVYDGYGVATTTYGYRGGYYDAAQREFRGFYQVTETDSLGVRKEYFFHQGGGRDGQALGEFDDTSKAKVGFPFRIETWGSVGGIDKKFSEILHKVEVEHPDPSKPAWEWPVVTRSLQRELEGQTSGFKSRARETLHDTTRGVVDVETDYGEVTLLNADGVVFSDPALPDDKLVIDYTYATLTNANILDRPSRILSTQDGVTREREELFEYWPTTGNLKKRQEWVDTTDTYVTEEFGYDNFGNLNSETDRAGLVTSTTFDLEFQQYPRLRQSTWNGVTFTNEFWYDARGVMYRLKDEKGLVVQHDYDKLYRIKETLVSSVANGEPDLWREKFDYQLDGITGFDQESENFTRHRVNDSVDATNGCETWEYLDGLGRTIQTRQEGEDDRYRVTHQYLNGHGSVTFRSSPALTNPSNLFPWNWETRPLAETVAGIKIEFDPIGRPFRTTPTALGGDMNSPSGPELREYSIWSERVTDAEGKIRDLYFDARHRLAAVGEHDGATVYYTVYTYDVFGNLTQIKANAFGAAPVNSFFTYNSLGQRTQMIDPDMGTWNYAYDSAGRLATQTDAKGNILTNHYDGRSRIVQVDIDKPDDELDPHFVFYTYDSSLGDKSYTVANGQLFKVEDNEGWEKYGYDHRGRELKATRRVEQVAKTHTLTTTYDEQSRPITITYPGGVAAITCSYDSAGHLEQIHGNSGAMGVTFYHADSWDDAGQLTGITYGNGVTSTFDYYDQTHRLKSIYTERASSSAVFQNLEYWYDKVGNVKRVIDHLEPTQHPADRSSSMSNMMYDDFHRLIAYDRNGTTESFSYTAIGNIKTNSESGGPQYTYHAGKRHAVTTAGNLSFGYDAAGNVVTRGSQTLGYDEQNRLTKVSVGSTTVVEYGYAHNGARLWKQVPGSPAHVWVGEYYEERGNIKVCHVIADGRRIASFIPVVPPLVTPTLKVDYFHHDQVGSTNVVTKQIGTQYAHFEYKAFGSSYFSDEPNPAIVDPLYKFTDQVLDDETGLYYYGSRYYDPLIGRFMQPDSLIPNLANPQTLNRYSYALNNPCKLVDPTGNFAFLPVFYAAVVAGTFSAVQAVITGDDVWDAFKRGALRGAILAIAGQLINPATLEIWAEADPEGALTPLAKETLAYTKLESFSDVVAFAKGIDYGEVVDRAVLSGAKAFAKSFARNGLEALAEGGDLSDVTRAALSAGRGGLGSGFGGGLKTALVDPKELSVPLTFKSLGRTVASAAKSSARKFAREQGKVLLGNAVQYYKDNLFAPPQQLYPVFGPYSSRMSMQAAIMNGQWPLLRQGASRLLTMSPEGAKDCVQQD